MQFKKILMTVFLIGSVFAAGKAQTVKIFYVGPSAYINTNFGVAGDTTNMPAGYSSIEIRATNTARFLSIVPRRLRYVFNLLQPGTTLRRQVERVFNNSGRIVDVEYYLVNDSARFSGAKRHMFATAPETPPFYVWPAASNVYDPGTRRYIGWVGLGETQLEIDQVTRYGLERAIDEVVLHESSHTQWVGEATKWPVTETTIYSYGADNSHSVTELLGDQELAINEGLATFYGYTLNQAGMDSMFSDFTRPQDRFFVEARSIMAGNRDLYTIPTRRLDTLKTLNERRAIQIVRYPNGDPVLIYLYSWRDVPGFYLLFAETTATTFYSLYWKNAYSNQDTAFSFIGASSFAMHDGRRNRFLTYSCNRLALKMEEYNQTAAGRADASKTSSLLPFALLDLVTHFGMSDAEYRADHDRQHPDRVPRAFNEYFTNHRNAIRTLVQADLAANPIRLQAAIDKIKTYCRQPATIW